MLYWPAFSRMAVMLVGPEGAGAGVVCARMVVVVHRRRRSGRENRV